MTRYNGDTDQQRRKKFSFPARLICADCYEVKQKLNAATHLICYNQMWYYIVIMLCKHKHADNVISTVPWIFSPKVQAHFVELCQIICKLYAFS